MLKILKTQTLKKPVIKRATIVKLSHQRKIIKAIYVLIGMIKTNHESK